MNLTVDQITAAANYLRNEWGDNGYWIEGIESPTTKVSLFRVVHFDGSRFTIAADKWGNCRDWDAKDTVSGEKALVEAMHQQASAS